MKKSSTRLLPAIMLALAGLVIGGCSPTVKVEAPDKPAGSIVAVLRRGWTSTQGVLRPAQVKVAGAPAAKGGEAAAGEGAA